VLVGPSGGYCLPAAFLERFAVIDAIEPDPLARWMFARRFPVLVSRVRWHATDYFAPAEGPRALERDFPARPALFCNLLGQLDFIHRDAPRIDGVTESFPPSITNQELVERFYDNPRKRPVELADHGTEGLCPTHRRRFLVWEISPGYFHLIEAIRRDDA
jgi:hypothetical protein